MVRVGVWELEQHYVRLWRIAFTQYQRILNIHDSDLGCTLGQDSNEAPDAARVRRPDGAHLDHLAGDELDAIVFAQYAQLGEPLVRLDRERARKQGLHHPHNIDSARMPS